MDTSQSLEDPELSSRTKSDFSPAPVFWQKQKGLKNLKSGQSAQKNSAVAD